jgi:2TM domain
MIDEAHLRKMVEKRVKSRQEFVQHLISYVLVNMLLWGIWLATSDDRSGTPWSLWVTGFWGVGLILHFFQMMSETSGNELTKELRLQKEIDAEREKLRRQGFTVVESQPGQKPKRNASISDDGELEYEDDEAEIEAEIQRHKKKKQA